MPRLRKQYQSCDRCRQGRRACDAVTNGANPLQSGAAQAVACSNCQKSKRNCTFDWLQQLPRGSLPERLKQKFSKDYDFVHYEQDLQPLRMPRLRPQPTSRSGDMPMAAPTQSASCHGDCHHAQGVGSTDLATDHGSLPRTGDVFGTVADKFDCAPQSFNWLVTSPTEIPTAGVGGTEGFLLMKRLEETETVMTSDNWDPPSSSWPAPPPIFDYTLSTEIANGIGRSEEYATTTDADPDHAAEIRDALHDSFPTDQLMFQPVHYFPTDLSTLSREAEVNSQDFQLVQSYTKSLICKTLLQIYLESFENIPSLYFQAWNWRYMQDHTPLCGSFSFLQLAKNLDKMLDPLRRSPLSPQESDKASNAFRYAVMAFASQWLEPDQAKSAGLTDQWAIHTGGRNLGEVQSQLQQELQYKAEDALRSCLGLTSFQVILAQLLFSWFRKPGLADSTTNHKSTPPRLPGAHNPLDHTVLAVQQLLSWRRNIIATAKEAADSPPQTTFVLPKSIPRQGFLAFSVMFRFGVMCDTTTAVMRDRLPVIPDQESVFEIEEVKSSMHPASEAVFSANRTVSMWDSLGPDSVCRFGMTAPRWPWTDDVAARVLQEVLALKNLLWRRLPTIQTSTASGSAPYDLEKHIGETCQIYQYVTKQYAEFLEDCRVHLAQLSLKLKSWYLMICSHWHLACLILARHIELIDETGQSELVQRSLRQSSALVWGIRKDNTYAISRVASVAILPDFCSMSCAREDKFFFFASQGALTTEPWSEVLYQSITRSCEILLFWIACIKDPNLDPDQLVWLRTNADILDLIENASACIEALKYLGGRSNHIMCTAGSMDSRLQELKMDALIQTQPADLGWRSWGQGATYDYSFTYDQLNYSDPLI
ncbi:hypothetical protein LTR84_005598 [Exophiala bonariae]|uniref:Zn(2)-C6 fungal-type domain-containing protein n=1 Tax=Exophiala bonariae TaxID=1690606 RepID=A0AAV9N654_9EURO|nr:hypothetical protein LTR84_005598 [Exophiala bonariae]